MKKIIIAVLIAVVLASAVAVVLSGSTHEIDNTTVPEDPGEGSDVDLGYEVPEGFIVDWVRYTVSCSAASEWIVYDMLSTYCVSSTLYEGYAVVGDSVTLGPGLYRLTVAGTVFVIGFGGSFERTSEWSYDFNGVKKAVSISYTIDIASLLEQKAIADRYNSDGHQRLFSELPAFAIAEDTILQISDSLKSEFIRIGGDLSDSQSYADFIASFVQMTIAYPDRISFDVEGGKVYKGEDYALYGQDEYWAMPLQTLYSSKGDCEDKSALLCALYAASGFDAAVGGKSGHLVAAVALDSFEEVPSERLKALNPFRTFNLTASVPVEGSCGPELSDKMFYAVETIYGQIPVGYMSGIQFGSNTFWGISGFYPCG